MCKITEFQVVFPHNIVNIIIIQHKCDYLISLKIAIHFSYYEYNTILYQFDIKLCCYTDDDNAIMYSLYHSYPQMAPTLPVAAATVYAGEASLMYHRHLSRDTNCKM